jgi:putrescine oxidase
MDVGGGGSGVLATFVTTNATKYLNSSEEEIRAAVLESFAAFYGPQALKPTAFVAKNW